MVTDTKKDPITASALTQHIAKLKKKTGGKAITGKPLVAAKKVPATPKKPTLPKTPTSSVKRKRDAMSDDEDDNADDNDSELDLHTVKLSKGLEKRNSLSRPSKNPNKKYEDPGSEVDADGENDDEADPTKDDGEDDADTVSDIFKNELTFDGAAEPKDAQALTDITNGAFSFGGQARMFARRHARKSITPGKKRSKTYNNSADESDDVSNFSDIMA